MAWAKVRSSGFRGFWKSLGPQPFSSYRTPFLPHVLGGGGGGVGVRTRTLAKPGPI